MLRRITTGSRTSWDVSAAVKMIEACSDANAAMPETRVVAEGQRAVEAGEGEVLGLGADERQEVLEVPVPDVGQVEAGYGHQDRPQPAPGPAGQGGRAGLGDEDVPAPGVRAPGREGRTG